jgi:drug/metabolite transporter (DMT)-like permease
LLRSGLDALGSVAWVTSIAFLPLANATAITMGLPLIIALMAVLALGEQVSARRWWAMATGFAGVLLVVQPAGEAFNAWSLVCLSAVTLFAGRDVMTRLAHPNIPSVLLTLACVLAAMLLSGAWVAFQGWVPMSAQQLAVVAGAAIFMAGGVFLVTVAMRAGEVGVIVPFRYSGLLFASVLGYALWGDVPNAMACFGMLLLVAAGLAVVGSR